MRFELTAEQMQKLSDWNHTCDLDAGCIGGNFTYKFTPVSIGVCVWVECVCGAELDLTDSDNW